jgi:hypothetical protein
MLPLGYTHWAYAGTYLKDENGGIPYVRQFGSTVMYAWQDTDVRQFILPTGTATTFATVSAATMVPPTSRLALCRWMLSYTHSVAGFTFAAYYRPAAGAVTSNGLVVLTSDSPGGLNPRAAVSYPTWLSATQTFQYRINSVPNTGGGLEIALMGYELQ